MASISWCSSVLAATLLLVAPHGQAQDATAIRGRVLAPLQDAPADVAAVALSATALLRGLKPAALPAGVAFAAGVAEKINDPHTRFEGFDVAGMRLSFLGPSGSGKPGRHVIGTLAFVDGAGRRAEETFVMDYVVQGDRLLVGEAAVRRQAPLRPRVEMYRMPASRVPADFLQRVRPFAETLDWLRRDAGDAKNPPAAKGEPLYVFAISLDRLESGDRLQLDAAGQLAQMLVDIGGWQLAVSRIEQLPDAPLTLRANYRSARLDRTVENLATLSIR